MESYVPECPYIEKHKNVVLTDGVNSDDLDFDTRMNPGRCITACICPQFGGHPGCCRPALLMNRCGLVHEALIDGVLFMSHLFDSSLHLCTDGGCLCRLFEDGRQRCPYESSEIFIEEMVRRL